MIAFSAGQRVDGRVPEDVLCGWIANKVASETQPEAA